jgi:hypothetical protein
MLPVLKVDGPGRRQVLFSGSGDSGSLDAGSRRSVAGDL